MNRVSISGQNSTKLYMIGICFISILFLSRFLNNKLDSQIVEPTPLTSNCNPPTFVETLRSYPWDSLLHSYKNKKGNTSDFSYWCSKLLRILKPALIAEPSVSINVSCRSPPPLQIPSSVPPCKKLASPRKVAVLLQHGFDADTLEIHFHELDAVVDKFFLIESTTTYYLGVSKPLIWEALKEQARFEKFLPKVIHFVLDDQELLAAQGDVLKAEAGDAKQSIYKIESLQEKMRWLKFLKWNNFTNLFGGDDLLGFGDVDEIPNRNVIHYLINCEMFDDPVDIGTWFPYGRVDQAFRTDFPVGNHPFTYGDPTYWTLRKALAYAKQSHFELPPTRKRGKSNGYIIGGIHMKQYGYFPFLLAKFFTTIEAVDLKVQNQFEVFFQFIMDEMRNVKEEASKSEQVLTLRKLELGLSKNPSIFSDRILKLDELKVKYPEEYKVVVKLPWFYDCNRGRYPMWEGKHDNRLD